MSAIKEQLKPLLSFINETEIKDLVFLLSKSPSRAIFDEIRTVDNLLTALEKWYGLKAMPIVLCNALMVADQRVLAVCIRNVCQGAMDSLSVEQNTVPSQLRQLMFKVISEFPDSKAVDLQRQMRLPNDPVPRDSLDLMATLLEKRIVTDLNIEVLLLLAPLNAAVDRICKNYEAINGVVRGSIDVGGNGRGGHVDTRRRRGSGSAPPGLDVHLMNEPVCIVMNVLDVPYRERRTGSEKDVERLVNLFRKFNYHVFTWIDPTLQQYNEYLLKMKGQLGRFGGLVLFVMSHGHDNYIELADGNRLHYKNDIIVPFLDGCLRGKPKIFCFQCCRGEQLLRAPINFDGPSGEPNPFSNLDNRELFVFHSTFEGFAAVREGNEGSWFIQTFCEKLDVPERMELEDLRRSVARDFIGRAAQVGPERVSQTPEADMNTLSKRVYLKPA